MKTRLIAIITAIFSIMSAVAADWLPLTGKTVNFNLDDYTLRYDDKGLLHIETADLNHFYGEDNAPGLPFTSTVVAMAGAYKYKSHTPLVLTKRLIATDVVLASNPIPIPTSMADKVVVEDNADYPLATYPASNCEFAGESAWDVETLLYFRLCPFVYNAASRELYFIDNIRFSYSTTAGTHNEVSLPRVPEHIQQLYPVQSQGGLVPLPAPASVSEEETVDYVIITSEKLAEAFKPLLDWKTTKGLRTKMVTIEGLLTSYPGCDMPLKIKKCLHELYVNNGLKYVLLGGDDSVVPVRGCFGLVNALDSKGESIDFIDNTIPTDLYYGCFKGTFDWDKNGNGIYGEIEDGVDITPDIYVTRAPTLTVEDTQAFVSKILAYEQEPLYQDRILMSGAKMSGYLKTGESDAEAKSDNIYQSVIKKYWQGERIRFFDTHTDFYGNESHSLTASNLQLELSKGYSFVDLITHGNQASLSMEEGVAYSSHLAEKLCNTGHTFIVTTACLTNAFDKSAFYINDPCLSESFIRNPNSGIIGYFGSSRNGWDYGVDDDGYGTSTLGSSSTFNKQFYRILFGPNYTYKSLGIITQQTKERMKYLCNSGYNADRWLLFSINPIGDPEMPIFIAKPKTFDNVSFSNVDGGLKIDVNEEDCKIAITNQMFITGPKLLKVYDNANSCVLTGIPALINVCITKQGFIPYNKKIYYVHDKSINSKLVVNADIVLFGPNNTQSSEGISLGEKSNITITSGEARISPNFTADKDAQITINF